MVWHVLNNYSSAIRDSRLSVELSVCVWCAMLVIVYLFLYLFLFPHHVCSASHSKNKICYESTRITRCGNGSSKSLSDPAVRFHRRHNARPPTSAGRRRPSDSGPPWAPVWVFRSSWAPRTTGTFVTDMCCSGSPHISPRSNTHHWASTATNREDTAYPSRSLKMWHCVITCI